MGDWFKRAGGGGGDDSHEARPIWETLGGSSAKPSFKTGPRLHSKPGGGEACGKKTGRKEGKGRQKRKPTKRQRAAVCWSKTRAGARMVRSASFFKPRFLILAHLREGGRVVWRGALFGIFANSGGKCRFGGKRHNSTLTNPSRFTGGDGPGRRRGEWGV